MKRTKLPQKRVSHSMRVLAADEECLKFLEGKLGLPRQWIIRLSIREKAEREGMPNGR